MRRSTVARSKKEQNKICRPSLFRENDGDSQAFDITPLPQFRFPHTLERAGTGSGKLAPRHPNVIASILSSAPAEPFSVPAAPSERRRAQRLSRPALPSGPPKALVLIAASTTACSGGLGEVAPQRLVPRLSRTKSTQTACSCSLARPRINLD